MRSSALHRWLRPSALGLCAALALCILLAAGLRFSAQKYHYVHPDEVISVRVAEKVVASGSLDTNWRHADLPPVFRYPQYNFSGYLLAAAGMLEARSWLPGRTDTLQWLRICSALLGTAAVFLTWLAGRRLFGTAAGLCGAAFVAVQPLLFQDSLYARPETFVTVLTLLVVVLAVPTATASRHSGIAAAFLLGLLVATKVSMLLLVPLLLMQGWRAGRVLVLPVLVGFVAGAPYALANAGDFLDGIRALQRQYAQSHWPYGIHEGTLLDRLAHAASYFHATTGWLIPLAFVGGVFAARRGEYRALLVLLVAVVTLVQFSSYPVFFERNISHVMPLFAIFAGYALVSLADQVTSRYGARPALLVLGLCFVAAPSASTTATLRWHELPGKQQELVAQKRTALERQHNLQAQVLGWTVADFPRAIGYRCDGPLLLEMPNLGDARTRAVLERLQKDEAFREVGRVDGAFPHVPPSTLQTYFTPPTVFLYRTPGTVACRSTGGYVAAASAGAPLPVLALETEPAWTRGGAYAGDAYPFEAGDVLGSWSGSDAHRGRLRLTVSVAGAEMVVLPFVTGPTAQRQRIEIHDATSGKLLTRIEPPQLQGWRLLVVRVPPGTNALRIEAADEGSGWGEWQAIGVPRRLRNF